MKLERISSVVAFRAGWHIFAFAMATVVLFLCLSALRLELDVCAYSACCPILNKPLDHDSLLG